MWEQLTSIKNIHLLFFFIQFSKVEEISFHTNDSEVINLGYRNGAGLGERFPSILISDNHFLFHILLFILWYQLGNFYIKIERYRLELLKFNITNLNKLA